MQTAVAPRPELSVLAPLTLRRLLPQAASEPVSLLAGTIERDRNFVTMLRAFRETGGLLRGDEVADLLVQKGTGDVSRLARWIVTRQVLSFEWRGELWIPMFQFNRRDMGLKNETRHIAGELAPAFDNWALALWFATPNTWLGDRLPAVAIDDDFSAVLQAARTDRYVAMG